MSKTRILRAIPLLGVLLAPTQGAFVAAAELKPETIRAWTAYAEATKRRIEAELSSDDRFLALDFQPPDRAAAEREAVLAGEIPIVEMATLDERGRAIDPPSGMIHHWRGAVFVPGARLDDIMLRVADPGEEDFSQEDVLEAEVLERGPDSLRVYLRLRRQRIVSVVFNSEHVIRYRRHDECRASSSSISTKIAEVENPNTDRERERPEGDDRGFLWRLNSHWRYQQVDGGVIVECESLSLSRDVPSLLGFMIGPLIDGTARESLRRTLEAMRDRHAVGLAGEEPRTGLRPPTCAGRRAGA